MDDRANMLAHAFFECEEADKIMDDRANMLAHASFECEEADKI